MPQRQSKKRKSKPAARSQPAQDKRKEKAPGPLDPEFCHSSESDPEDYGDLHGQEEWEIDGVVDSHCGENGRMSYKVLVLSLWKVQLFIALRSVGTRKIGNAQTAPVKSGYLSPRTHAQRTQT
ncbi:unnamed protein product [Rhizoctonia solani]|uniref:Uncharacterized protein n=1 Tax=Rhizoctonia solani TaxID=456999 RepID=A0A8H3AIP9_9AGAM|nr:unnamed protein product [Rhizoctonia solani]